MIYIVTNAVPILLAGLAGAALIASLWRSRDGGIGLLIATLAGSLWLAAILAGALILAPVDAQRWIPNVALYQAKLHPDFLAA